jgi:hypothetical protein
VRCSFAAKSDFGTIHAINARFAAGSAARRDNNVSGQEPEFHQTPGDVVRQLQTVQHARLSFRELGERINRCVVRHGAWSAVDTHLQYQSVSASRVKHVKNLNSKKN